MNTSKPTEKEKQLACDRQVERDLYNRKHPVGWAKNKLDHVERHGAAESFSEWLDSHGDSLPLPKDFSEWIDQTNDSIIQ